MPDSPSDIFLSFLMSILCQSYRDLKIKLDSKVLLVESLMIHIIWVQVSIQDPKQHIEITFKVSVLSSKMKIKLFI